MKPNKWLILLFLLPAGLSFGQKVHLKTGNFSVKHTDISLAGKLSVDRVYNSTSKYKSIFGTGWAYDYSKVLVVNPDGSLVTKECECEGRTDNVYNPTTFNETAKSLAIDRIAAVSQQLNPKSAEEGYKYKLRLANDRGFFIDEWKRLLDLKKIEQYEVPEGTKFISKSFGFAVITRTKDGYEMTMGSTHKFYNNKGLLVREENGKDWLELKYNELGQLVEIGNNLNSKLLFNYNKQGFVSEITSVSKMVFTAKYTYKNDQLLSVKSNYQDVKYTYTYSNDDNNLLVGIDNNKDRHTKIVYAKEPENKTEVLMTSPRDSVRYTYSRKTTDEKEYVRDGGEETFYANYSSDGDDDDEDNGGKNTKTKYSQWTKNKIKEVTYYITTLADGYQYNYRTITNNNGIKEDVYNNEEGDPDKIIKYNDTTFFTYNRFGEITYKDSRSQTEELEYHSKCAKILSYKKTDKNDGSVTWSKFAYNNDCELEKVENSEGDKISLTYDDKGKISGLNDLNDNTSLTFLYNEMGKPIKISLNDGSIDVTYDQFGEIDKVKSDQGHTMALKVTQAFQKLLKLTKVENLKPCKCRL